MSEEDLIKERLTARFEKLHTEGRCVFAREVWLMTWGHITKGAQRVRADFVASLDGGPLLAVECKGSFCRQAEIGDALRQTGDYARAQVAPQEVKNRLPPTWVGNPIRWAALAYNYRSIPPHIQPAAEAAHRLFGPSNVGFLTVDKWQGLKFILGADRYWSEANGWRVNAMVRTTRLGTQRMGVSE
jgi:hypothetical protein